MAKVRFGILGCGRIAPTHATALRSLSTLAELAGVCDCIPSTLSRFANTFSAPAFSTYAELLAAEIDAVIVCTPSGLHPEHGIQAAEAGKHVITEKPIGVRLEDADRLIDACDRNGVKLFVVMQNRFNPPMAMLKRAIAQGRFGRIYHVNAEVQWLRLQEYYDSAAWRGTWAMDGGAFLNQAVHYVDALAWLGGPVECVTAQAATLARRMEAEDCGTAVFRFASGALGTLTVTMLAYPTDRLGCVTVMGENGYARVGGVAMNQLEHWEFSECQPDDVAAKSASYETISVYGNSHETFLEDAVRSIREDLPPSIGGIDGRASLELVRAIYQASETGTRVRLAR